MVRMLQGVGLVVLLAVLFAGCSQQGVEEKTYQVKMPSGIEQARQVLQRYADGSPVGSEATTFPEIVAKVRESDPQKADLLEKGFAEIEKSKGKPAAKAKELLGQL